MQELIELLQEAADQGITLWATPERSLRFRSKAAPLKESFRARLVQHKNALIDALSEPALVPLGSPDEAPFLLHYHDLWQNIRAGSVNATFINGTHRVWKVFGDFDAERFAVSVEIVVRRHRILATRVDDSSGVPCFRYGASVAVESVDLGSETLASEEEAAMVGEIVWRPFASDETLFRTFVARTSARRHFVGFVINHLISDGISVSIVARELLDQYEGRASESHSGLSAPVLQYSDYLLGMNAWLRSSALEYRLGYWRQQLDGVRPCGLPVKRSVSSHEPSAIEDHRFALGNHRTERLYSTARRMQVTPYSVLLAAQTRAFCELSGESSIAVRSMHHGRDSHETLTVVGSFQNHLVLRVPASPADSFESTVRTCQELHAAAIRNQIPYHYVRRCVLNMGADNWFPELNCRVAGTAGPAQQINAKSPLRRDPSAPIFMHFAVQRRPAPSSPRSFPGYKLSMHVGGTEIRGSVLYLGSAHDVREIAEFVSILTRWIDEGCRS